VRTWPRIHTTATTTMPETATASSRTKTVTTISIRLVHRENWNRLATRRSGATTELALRASVS
jgi:hypothetical protein